MKAIAVMLTLCLCGSAFAADAPAPSVHRSWLTGVGIGLVGAGLGVAGFGLNAVLTAQDSDRLLKIYYPSEGVVPRASEISVVSALEMRRSSANTLVVPSFAISGSAVAAGLLCILIDALIGQPESKYVAGVSILPGGAGFTLVAHF